MAEVNFDIFMKALKEVNPEVVYLYESATNKEVGVNRVKTFEDCAAVEKEIYDKLNGIML